MAKVRQVALGVGALLLLSLLLFRWMGGESGGQFGGWRFGASRPPAIPGDAALFVSLEAKSRGLNGAQQLPLGDLTYDGDTSFYSAEWTGTRDSKPVRFDVKLKSAGGKWRVVTWQEK